MPSEKAGETLKTIRDRCASAGRFFRVRLDMPRADWWRHALTPGFFRAVGVRAGVAVLVLLLASSAISDPLQRFTDSGMHAALRVDGTQDFRSYEQQERLALLRRVAGDADAVRALSGEQLVALLGVPGLRRAEAEAESWHYTSKTCALDIYFPRAGDGHPGRPLYAEYRVRGEADTVATRQAAPDHHACLMSLFAQARRAPREQAQDAF